MVTDDIIEMLRSRVGSAFDGEATFSEDEIEKIVSALSSSPAPVAAGDWVMVPREPTPAMMRAGVSWSSIPAQTWQDMLDAAPTPPAPAQPIADRGVEAAWLAYTEGKKPSICGREVFEAGFRAGSSVAAGDWYPTHRHKKRGTHYQHIGTALIQSDVPLSDLDVVEIYAGREGDLWARRQSEFYDGRFGRIATTPTPPAQAQPTAEPVEKLGRFGHHPDPAIDFEVEVETIQGLLYDATLGVTSLDGISGIVERIDRAMEFRTGGDLGAVAAKQMLRGLEKEAKKYAAPAHVASEAQVPLPPVGEIDALIERLLDAQQDINLSANETMSQPLCDASALIDEVETLLVRLKSALAGETERTSR